MRFVFQSKPWQREGWKIDRPRSKVGLCDIRDSERKMGVKTNGEVEKRAFVRTADRKERSGSVQLSALLVPLNADRGL